MFASCCLRCNCLTISVCVKFQPNSLWAEYCDLLPAADEYIVNDYQCEEFAALVKMNTELELSSIIKQMILLFQLLDRDWEQQFKKFTITKVSSCKAKL